MPTINLIIALVFAGIFGTALVYLGLCAATNLSIGSISCFQAERGGRPLSRFDEIRGAVETPVEVCEEGEGERKE
ncbi:hypothetical protein J4E91_000070 [Alternaria rosae]|nr:hypothetical protein J4E91_000070 [Alternaria rosae]